MYRFCTGRALVTSRTSCRRYKYSRVQEVQAEYLMSKQVEVIERRVISVRRRGN